MRISKKYDLSLEQRYEYLLKNFLSEKKIKRMLYKHGNYAVLYDYILYKINDKKKKRDFYNHFPTSGALSRVLQSNKIEIQEDRKVPNPNIIQRNLYNEKLKESIKEFLFYKEKRRQQQENVSLSKVHLSRKAEFVKSIVSMELISAFLKKYNSCSMLIDFLFRKWRFQNQTERILLFNKYFVYSDYFSKTIKYMGFKFDCKKYNKLPPWEKQKYRFDANVSPEEIRNRCIEDSRRGQVLSNQVRDRANWSSVPFKREWSPLCREFYAAKGLAEEEIDKKLYSIQSSGAHACLKTTQKPSTEKIIKKWLEENDITFSEQLRINTGEMKKSFVYDFLICDKNVLLECNGTYWHCDPRFFKIGEKIFFPGRCVNAEDIWAKDLLKEKLANEYGYQVYSIWEYDIHKNTEKVEEDLCRILGIQKNCSNMSKLIPLCVKRRKSRSTI